MSFIEQGNLLKLKIFFPFYHVNIPSFLLDDSLLEDDTYHHNIRPLQRMQKMAICLISFLILVCILIKSLFNQFIKA